MDWKFCLLFFGELVIGISFLLVLDRFVSKLFKGPKGYKKGEQILPELPPFTGEILFNGEKMTDFDPRSVIPSMKEENPDFIEFDFGDKFYISVSAFDGGIGFSIPKKDGSTWTTDFNPVSPDKACDYVEQFLEGKNEWMSELEWDQMELPTKEGNIRMLIIGAVGLALFILVTWLNRILDR